MKITFWWSANLVLEVLSVVALFATAPDTTRFSCFLLCHGAAAVCGAALLARALPIPGVDSLGRLTAFLAALLFFIPYLGWLGFYMVLVVVAKHPVAATGVGYQRVDVPDLPQQAFERAEVVPYGEGALAALLRHAEDPELRLKAVLSIRHLDDATAVPLLRVAVRDPVDDVRLTAYAMLDRKEDRINKTIKSLLDRLPDAVGDALTVLHGELGASYWRLADIGLAQGEVLEHILKTARCHAELAVERDIENPARHFLLGRILVRLGCYGEARARLDGAARLGLPSAAVAPYVAEAFFQERKLDQLRAVLRKLSPAELNGPSLRNVAPLWL